MVALLGLAAFSGAAAAHDDGDGLTAHNQTQPLDQHDEVHTITIDKATADTGFYVDVHANDSTINKTATFEAGTTLEDLELDLEPTIESDTEVTVATHTENGTEIANETITVDVVEAPTVSFSDQVQELDEHEEVHTIDVATVAANQDYYVDVHTDNGTLNETRTFEGGTAQTDLTLDLDPTLKSTTNVTVAVHAANETGTELASETATVTTADVQFSDQTRDADEVQTISVEKVSAGKPFYVDVHANGSTINETATFEAGTALEDLELDLNSAIESDTEVTVAVHAADETELAASTALVNVTDSTGAEQTETTTTEGSGDGHETDTETHEATTTEESSGSGPGFGVIAAVVASIGAALIGRRFGGNGEA